MKKQLKLQTLLGLVVIVSMLLAAVPMGTAKAATPSTDLGTWSDPVTLANVSGRPTVIYDSGTYHMWYTYGGEDKDLYYTSSTNPLNFNVGLPVTGLVAGDQASPAVLKVGSTFYMVNYTDTTEKSFSIFTSTNGKDWGNGKVIYSGVGLPTFLKIDAPSLIYAGSEYKLYFQVKTTDGTNTFYNIYLATSTTLDGTYTLYGSTPVVAAGTTSGAWDYQRVAQPTVLLDGADYVMWFAGSSTQYLGYVHSSDGIAWIDRSQILTSRGAEPTAVYVNGAWQLWYLDANHTISYITSRPETAFVTVDQVSTQPDGTIVASIYGKSTNLYGVELHLTFPAALLSVQSIDLAGTGLAANYPTQNKFDNAAGTIDIAYTQEAPAVPVAGDNILLGKVTFKALVPTATSSATIGFSDVKFSDKDGFPTGTVVPTSASVIVNPWTGIQGQFGLQGRTDYSGIAVTLDTTPVVNTPVNGLYAFPQILEGSHTLTAQKSGYLTATWTLSLLSQPYTFPYVMLLGGDTDGNKTINIDDLGAIGSDYLNPVKVSTYDTDINDDGIVNIFDLTMAGGNYEKTSTTAYAGLLP